MHKNKMAAMKSKFCDIVPRDTDGSMFVKLENFKLDDIGTINSVVSITKLNYHAEGLKMQKIKWLPFNRVFAK